MVVQIGNVEDPHPRGDSKMHFLRLPVRNNDRSIKRRRSSGVPTHKRRSQEVSDGVGVEITVRLVAFEHDLTRRFLAEIFSPLMKS